MQDKWFPLTIYFLLCVWLFVVSNSIFYHMGQSSIKHEAVKNNCAHYVSDERGNPEFIWGDNNE